MTKLVRYRRPVSGPELHLIRMLLASRFLHRRGTNPVLFREPELPSGCPDILAAYVSENAPRISRPRKELGLRHIKLLHFIYQHKGIHLDDIGAVLSIRPGPLATMVADLQRSDLIHRMGSFIRPRSMNNAFGLTRLLAIEAKISDWRRAIEQAIANQWFASESYIALPPIRSNELLRTAKKFGVGLIVVQPESTEILLTARRSSIPVSYGSWVVNELVLRRQGGG